MPDDIILVKKGAAITVYTNCGDHKLSWTSSELEQRNKKIDVDLCALTGINGSPTTETLDMFDKMKVRLTCPKTIYNYRGHFNQAVADMYEDSIERARKECESLPRIKLLGDAQFDSPGLGAANCTYLVVSSQTEKVVHSKVYTKEMAKSSGQMEEAAASQCLDEMNLTNFLFSKTKKRFLQLMDHSLFEE